MTIKKRQLDFGSFLYEKRNITWNYIYFDVDLGFIYLCNKGNNIFKHVHEYYFEHHISVKIVIKYIIILIYRNKIWHKNMSVAKCCSSKKI
jgi:hypothetical protein